MSTTTPERQDHAAGRRGLKDRIDEALQRPRALGTLMLGPAVLYVVAFVAVSFFIAIALSMSDATVGDPDIDSFVGLSNFVAVTQQDAFVTALRNSLIITGATVAGIVILATIAVEILAREFRGKRLVQVLFMMPWAMPVALAAITWLWLLDSQFSPIDWILVQVGLLGPGTPLGPASSAGSRAPGPTPGSEKGRGRAGLLRAGPGVEAASYQPYAAALVANEHAVHDSHHAGGVRVQLSHQQALQAAADPAAALARDTGPRRLAEAPATVDGDGEAQAPRALPRCRKQVPEHVQDVVAIHGQAREGSAVVARRQRFRYRAGLGEFGAAVGGARVADPVPAQGAGQAFPEYQVQHAAVISGDLGSSGGRSIRARCRLTCAGKQPGSQTAGRKPELLCPRLGIALQHPF